MATIYDMIHAAEDRKRYHERAIQDAKDVLKRLEKLESTREIREEYSEVKSRMNRAIDEVRKADRQLADAKKVAEEDEEIERKLRDIKPTSAYRPESDGGLASEYGIGNGGAGVYNRTSDPSGSGLFLDVARAYLLNDREANERLTRYALETRAGTGVSGDFSGLVIPQYLTDMAAPAVSNRSAFRDSCHTRHPLPAQGMALEVPLGTATSAAEQGTELTTVSTTQAQTTMLTIPVRTYSGAQLLSRQAIERGNGIDQFIVRDLQIRLAASIDSALLNTASVGALAVANSTTSAATSPEMLYQEIVAAASRVEKALLGAPADRVVMDSDTFSYLESALTANHPLMGNGSFNAGSLGQPNYGPGVRAILPNGLAVVVDNNVPLDGTNHQVLVLPAEEAHLFMNESVLIRAEQPSAQELGILLVVYQYAAYTYSRYADVLQKIVAVTLA